MSTNVSLTDPSKRNVFARGVSLASMSDQPCVLNTDASTVNADPTNIVTILSGDAAVIEMPVPLGATYLKACLAYVGTTPSAPAIRVFGRLPILKGYQTALLPEGVHASYGAWTLGKGNGEGLWVPRGNDALGVYSITLSTTTAMKISTGFYCEPAVIHVGGCDKVVVPIVTAATGATRALIFGWFEQ